MITVSSLAPPTTNVGTPTVRFGGHDPEPTLGGLALSPAGLTGDPSVLSWMAGIASTGRVW